MSKSDSQKGIRVHRGGAGYREMGAGTVQSVGENKGKCVEAYK